MNVIENLNALRNLMKERKIDVYVIPTSDFHETEYVGEYFKARAFMSGFSGSAGTLVVSLTQAALWTDGRYFIQAANELAHSSIQLMKQGEEGVPTIAAYIQQHLSQDRSIGFDGRVVSSKFVQEILADLDNTNATIHCDEDLVDIIWSDRPALSQKPAFLLDEKYSGRSVSDKLRSIREDMNRLEANYHIVTTLDDIAWILDMRGSDIASYPVALAFLIITDVDAHLFIDETKVNDALHANFVKNHINVQDYHSIYEFVKKIPVNACVLFDSNKVNYQILLGLPPICKRVDHTNPSQLKKAIKNDIELENTRNAHIKDGVAVTKFMYWLKQNIGNIAMDERFVSDYLWELRSQQALCMDTSFSTIVAYKEHAAMMHYSATPESNATLLKEGMLLVDSGGQYYDGTTDITRTFVLGKITNEEKVYFTTALRSLIALSKASFLHGCRGFNLDILARGPLWEMAMDYKCGTGHGVGHVLNVHEGPNGFRWKVVTERNDSCILEPGMLQSNEPGVYVEGQFGIRHENEVVVIQKEKNEYGQFLSFETLTFVPFDLDGVDAALLTQYEKAWLNAYHQEVYEKIAPHMSEQERVWLKDKTRAI